MFVIQIKHDDDGQAAEQTTPTTNRVKDMGRRRASRHQPGGPQAAAGSRQAGRQAGRQAAAGRQQASGSKAGKQASRQAGQRVTA